MSIDEKAGKARKTQARFIGDVPGCFIFLDRAGSDWDRRTFPFSARSLAATRAVVSADVPVERGEGVALRFDNVGVRRGIVEKVMKTGFIVNLLADEIDGEEVDARIGWLSKKARRAAMERRAHKRVLPKNSAALLVLGAERTIECRIKDMSASGAALVAPVQPAVGSLLAVGAVPARVVRHFEGGFAVRFLELQDMTELEALLTLRTRREKSLAARKLGFAA